MSILVVSGLSVVYEPQDARPTQAVRDVSFSVEDGEFVGIVGESGSGKSTLGFAIARLLKPPARISSGSVSFAGEDVAALSDEQLRASRRGGFAMVLQAGMNALNPVRRVSGHFDDIFRAHGHVDPAARQTRAAELLEKVRLAPAVLDMYPGELSGGMRQRVSIALALSLEPRLMIFDEPTTALDVLVQKAVMDTIRELQQSEGFTAILISHDLGVVLESTRRVLVMHEGEIVEDAEAEAIVRAPEHPYTRMLLSHYADPRAEVIELPGLTVTDARVSTAVNAQDAGASDAHEPVVLEAATKTYPGRRRRDADVTAVDHVSFRVDPGESVALVGQSGSGKSTIAKLITGVEKPSSGLVRFGETNVGSLGRNGLRELRRQVQLVFQDPYSALNPLHTVEYVLTRPVRNYLRLEGSAARRRVLELLETVGLTPVEDFAAKLPHQLSGGQRQRVVIARALASHPQVIIADEPVSMLDVSLRAGILALLGDLRSQFGVSMLYITHDLLSARLITERIIVMHDGRIVEEGPTREVMMHPKDAYTVQLLDAIPKPGSRDAV